MTAVSQKKPISAVLLLLVCTILSTCLFAKPVTTEQVRKVTDTFIKAQDIRQQKQVTLSLAEAPVTFVCKWDEGKPIHSVAVHGDCAYVGTEDSLIVLDVSDPCQPEFRKELSLGPGTKYRTIRDIALSGNYAYLGATTAGMYIIDISQPFNPSLVSNWDPPCPPYDHGPYGIAVSGNYVYTAELSYGLRVTDVSDPHLPKQVCSYDPYLDVPHVVISGNYAYLATSRGSTHERGPVEVIDVSDPYLCDNPCGKTLHQGYLYGLAVSGNYLYATNSDLPKSLVIFDISIPCVPKYVGSCSTPGQGAYRVAVSGRYACIADGAKGLSVVDISDPYNPALVYNYDTAGNAGSIAVAGNYIYLTQAGEGGTGLVIFRIEAEGPQVTLKRFEINQCFQGVEMDGVTQAYALIETKPFVTRVTLESSSPANTSVKVKLAVFNSTSGNQIGKTKQKNTTIKYGTPQTVDFLFNDNDTKDMKSGDYRFSLIVEDSGGSKLLEQNLTYQFKSSSTVRMLVVVLLQNGVQIAAWNPNYINFIEQVLPVPKTTTTGVNRLEILPPISLDVSSLNTNSLLSQLVKSHIMYNIIHLFRGADFICAVVPAGTLGGDTVGIRSGHAILIEAHPDSTYILGHEIGHIYDLGEEYIFTLTRDWRTGLWLLDQTFAFDRNPPPLKLVANGPFIISWLRPYPGQICDWSDDADSYSTHDPIHDTSGNLVGWLCDGRYIGQGGYDVQNNVKVSSSTFSMMSAATGFSWISGPEYKSLINNLVPTGKASQQVKPLSFGETRVIVSGIINTAEATSEIDPLIPAPSLEPTPEVNDPNLSLSFISKDGFVLGSFKFAPLESEYIGVQRPFCVIVDLPTGTAVIQVTIAGNVAGELRLTDNSPTVQVLSPNGGEQIVGQLSIAWSASDLDSNELKYTIEFSDDNGSEWNTLAIDHNDDELTVDSNYLPGGNNCLIKVIASDGWNRSEDTSDASFSIATKSPKVTILDPADKSIFLHSANMQGRCSAYDPETGDINDPNKIVWSSNVDGFLGKGNLVGFQLTLGDHLLSATVTDPEGKTATGTVKVSVAAKRSDINRDLSIDIFDFGMLVSNWLLTCSEPNWCEGTDLNFSGKIDFDDFAIFARNWLWKKIVADLDIDDNVALTDYAILANYWMNENCDKAGWCRGADLDQSRKVDILDLAILAEHWLEGTMP